MFTGAFRAVGLNARVSPPGDARTRELAARHLTGDECYPQAVTLGNFLKIAEEPGFDPARTAFFMPQATGPCRFGQYNLIVKKVFAELGMPEVMVLSPTCDNGYRDLGENGSEMMHYGWWALAAGDLLRKMLHRFRPYELKPGTTDAVYDESIEDCTETLAERSTRGKAKFKALLKALERCRERFNAIEADFSQPRLLIGITGEIFCRLNTYSNEDVVRRIEAHGGQAWVSDIAEWVFYVNYWEMEEKREFGKRYTPAMFKAWLSDRIQHKEEHQMFSVFARELAGLEEPETIQELMDYAKPYLEPHAAQGEMILNVGRAVYLRKKDVDAVADISPFSCMNAIVSEAVYPQLSEDLDGMPIRNFYFDGTGTNVDEDVEIFMELAGHFGRVKEGSRKSA